MTAEADWPLVVIGKAGTGKTSAALCLLDYTPGYYWTANGLSQALADAAMGRMHENRPDGRPITTSSLWSDLVRSRLVVLDELGARSQVSEHHYDSVKRLLDVREGKPLLCLSNLPIERLAAIYDDRVASRLAAGTVVIIEGEDRRLCK